MHINWQPTATVEAMRARADMLSTIRKFFSVRGVLEVETPLLAHAGVTDLYLDNFTAQFEHSSNGQAETLFLQTSPEFAMKRLLCAGSGPIYQICKAFRHEGGGRYHNPEFSMLEWYRPGFDHWQLMAEMDALLQQVLACEAAEQISYQSSFLAHLNVDPLTVSYETLGELLAKHNIDLVDGESLSRDDRLQLLFATVIEPQIGQDKPCFVHSFPASQAALAKLNKNDPRVADRFEVYYRGIELANGFYELSDAKEQRARFEHDNQLRSQAGKAARPIDYALIDALESGLPDCAGVALGLDRLLMLKVGASHINDILTFPVERA